MTKISHYSTVEWAAKNRLIVKNFLQLRDRFGIGSKGNFSFKENSQDFREATNFIGNTLLTVPLRGTDGKCGERTYYAHPMHFYDAYENLRKIGSLLANYKDNFPGKGIVGEIGQERLELYKLEVRIPSELLGFNIDACKRNFEGLPDAIIFQVFDGGLAFSSSNKQLTMLASFRLFFESSNPEIHSDFIPETIYHIHEIDEYTRLIEPI